jgi:PTH1 family peptidyl-tRNA hydrolase
MSKFLVVGLGNIGSDYAGTRHNIGFDVADAVAQKHGASFRSDRMDKEKIAIEHILVILDDLALPLSKVRLRPSGSDAGHNGLTSIQESLTTDKYPRLRFGIGNNFPKGRQVDFVLGRWSDAELALVRKKIDKCVEVVESFATIGIERTMNEANKLEFIL